MLGPVAGAVDLTRDGEVELLHLCPCLQVEHAEAEEVERFLTDLLCIVPCFQHARLCERFPNIVEFLYQFMVIFLDVHILGPLGEGGCLQHLEYQYGVVRREGATRLGDDVGVGDLIFVGSVDEGEDRVVHILLNGIVDAVLGEGGAGAVIVYPQSATDVNELNLETHAVQLHVELCRLTQGGLDAAYLGDLAADVEVYQPEAFGEVVCLEHLQRFQQLAGVEAELAAVAARLLPLAAATAGQLHPYADVGLHLESLGDADCQLQLVEFLHHDEDLLAHLLCQQGQLDVALILVAVADDE